MIDLNEHGMLRELTARFVQGELMPLEAAILEREARGQGRGLLKEEEAVLDERARVIGLWGIDVPAEFGGADLPASAMITVHEEMSKTIVPYILPPDSPNLAMLMTSASPEQRQKYLDPYARGELRSCMAISEPGAGGDPASMRTNATREGDEWVINGRKIWVSFAGEADFAIVMATTDREKGAKGISAFLVEKGTPGFQVYRSIPMIGGGTTYELVFDNCRIPVSSMLGSEGQGYGPMQQRLSVRRLQLGAWCLGLAQRAVSMMVEHVRLRKTFGVLLADRQAIQWWIADAETRIHACRLMLYDAAYRLQNGERLKSELSMIKVFATEMAWDIVDNAMQSFGAMGMTKELPLQYMANRIRIWRIVEGPSEVHRMVIARNRLRA